MKMLTWVWVVVLALLLVSKCREVDAPRGTAYDTIAVYDTVRHDSLVVRDSVVLRYEVVKLPVGQSDSAGVFPHDSVAGFPRDSVAVVLPITQRHYEEDDFEAWVSGYRPSLDSIRVFPKEYYLKPKPAKPKRWVLSAGVNVGYNPFAGRFEPTIGVSVGVKLWEW